MQSDGRFTAKEPAMFNKVLVLSASADAVEKAFRELTAAGEIRNIDTLQYTNKVFRHFYSKAYIEMVNKAPEVLGWLYDLMDKPWKNERRRLALDKLNTRPFVKMLKEYRPEITVCTHFLPAEIISWLTAKRRLDTRQAIIVTDFDVHAMWLCHHYAHYFVAMEETKVHMAELGIPADKITVSGIPIDPVFATAKDKAAMREKYGLAKNRTTILISAGGFGVGSIENMIHSLLTLRHPAQVIAICGRNEELKGRLDGLVKKIPAEGRVTVRAVGFTREMDEYMAASDILLGKPGGLTTSEALARGLAFVIVSPIPGQEERNSDHLLEEGVAIRCNNLPVLGYKIDRLLDEPERFARMQANARRLGRPNAAKEIVRKLLVI
jgi:processive 1,2-diacylglycerol beta-glucosyltransferase